jgi:hypothetical protein
MKVAGAACRRFPQLRMTSGRRARALRGVLRVARNGCSRRNIERCEQREKEKANLRHANG